jgi:acylphosphatase
MHSTEAPPADGRTLIATIPAMESDPIRRRVIVQGRVQGVFFRDSARRRAVELGVAGWVRNCSDGTVEALFQGSPAAVQAAVEWCRTGPPRAHVTAVHEFSEPVEPLTGFTIR